MSKLTDIARAAFARLAKKGAKPSPQRYKMGADQPAQIDCRVEECRFRVHGGQCTNISPAITLRHDGSFACWSQEPLTDDKV